MQQGISKYKRYTYVEINSYFEYAESKFYHFAERESDWSQNTSQNENKHSLSKYAFKIWRYVWAEDIYDAVKCGMRDVLSHEIYTEPFYYIINCFIVYFMRTWFFEIWTFAFGWKGFWI